MRLAVPSSFYMRVFATTVHSLGVQDWYSTGYKGTDLLLRTTQAGLCTSRQFVSAFFKGIPHPESGVAKQDKIYSLPNGFRRAVVL